jgi:hypothetical protein
MGLISSMIILFSVRFEVFTAVTMKNGVLQEPHGVTAHKTPFFNSFLFFKAFEPDLGTNNHCIHWAQGALSSPREAARAPG